MCGSSLYQMFLPLNVCVWGVGRGGGFAKEDILKIYF